MDNPDHPLELGRIRSAIAPLVEAFATDGYLLRILDFDGHRLTMAIDAKEGSCPDCLVPHEVMAGLIRTKLPVDLASASIEIAYPASDH